MKHGNTSASPSTLLDLERHRGFLSVKGGIGHSLFYDLSFIGMFEELYGKSLTTVMELLTERQTGGAEVSQSAASRSESNPRDVGNGDDPILAEYKEIIRGQDQALMAAQTEITSLKQSVSEMQVEMDRKGAEGHQASEREEQAKPDLESQAKEERIQELEAELEIKTQEMEGLANAYSQLDEELARFNAGDGNFSKTASVGFDVSGNEQLVKELEAEKRKSFKLETRLYQLEMSQKELQLELTAVGEERDAIRHSFVTSSPKATGAADVGAVADSLEQSTQRKIAESKLELAEERSKALDEEVKKLMDRVVEAERKFVEANGESSRLQTRVRNFEQDAVTLRTNHKQELELIKSAASSHEAQLRTEVEKLQIELHESQSRDTERDLQILRDENTEQRNLIALLRAEIVEIRTEAEKRETQRKATAQELAEVSSTLLEVRQGYEALKVDHSRESDENHRLATLVREMQASSEAAAQTGASKSEDAAKAAQSIAELKAKLFETENQLKIATSELEKAKTDAEGLTDQIVRLSERLANTEDSRQAEEMGLKAAQREIHQLQETLKAMETEKAEAVQMNTNGGQDYYDVQAMLRETQAALREAEGELDRYKARGESQSVAVTDDLKAELSSAEERRLIAERKLKDVQVEFNRERKESAAGIALLKTTMDERIRELSEELVAANNVLARERSNQDDTRTTLIRLETMVSEKEEMVREREGRIDALLKAERSLKEQVEESEKKIAELTATLATDEKEKHDLEGELIAANSVLSQQARCVMDIFAQFESDTAVVEEVRASDRSSQMNEVKRVLRELRASRTEALERVLELEGEKTTLVAQTEETEEMLKEKSARVHSLEDEQRSMVSKVEAMETEMTTLQNSSQEALTRVQTLEKSVQDRVDMIFKLEDDLSTAGYRIEELEEKVTAYETEADRNRDSMSRLEDALAKKEEVQNELVELHEKLKVAKEEERASAAVQNKLQESLTIVEEEKETLCKTLSKKKEELTNVVQEKDDASNRLREMNAVVTASSDKITRMTEQLSTLQEELLKAEEELCEHKLKAENSADELERVKMALEVALTEQEAMEGRNRMLEDDSRTQRSRLEFSIGELNDELKSLKETNLVLSEKQTHAETSMLDLRKQIEVKSDLIFVLEGEKDDVSEKLTDALVDQAGMVELLEEEKRKYHAKELGEERIQEGLVAVEEKLTLIERALEQKSSHLKTALEKNKDLNTILQDREEKLEVTMKEFEAVKASIAEMESSKQSLLVKLAESEEVASKLANMKVVCAAKDDTIEEISSELDDAREEVLRSRTALNHITSQVNVLTDQVKEKDEIIEGLKKDLENNHKDSVALREQLTYLQEEMCNVDQALQKKTKELAELESASKLSLESERLRLEGKISSVTKVISDLEAKLVEKDKELAETKTKTDADLEKMNVTLKEMEASSTLKLSQSQDETERAKKEIEELTLKFESEREAELMERRVVESAKEELLLAQEGLESANETLVEDKTGLERANEMLLGEKTSLECAMERLLEEKADLVHAKEMLLGEKTDLEDAMETLSKEKADLVHAEKLLLGEKANLEHARETLLEEKADLVNAKEKLFEEKLDLEERLTEKEAREKELRTDVEAKQALEANLKEQVLRVEELTKTLAKIGEERTQMEGSHSRAMELEDSVAELQQKTERLLLENEQLRLLLNEGKEKSMQAEGSLQVLNMRIEMLSEQLDDKKKMLAMSEDARKELLQRMTLLESKLPLEGERQQEETARVAALKGELKQANVENVRLARDLEAVRTQLEQVVKTVAVQLAALGIHESRSLDEKTDWSSIVSDVESDFGILLGSIEKQQRDLTEAEKKLSFSTKMAAEVSELKKELAAAKAKLENYEELTSSVEDKYLEELASLKAKLSSETSNRKSLQERVVDLEATLKDSYFDSSRLNLRFEESAKKLSVLQSLKEDLSNRLKESSEELERSKTVWLKEKEQLQNETMHLTENGRERETIVTELEQCLQEREGEVAFLQERIADLESMLQDDQDSKAEALEELSRIRKKEELYRGQLELQKNEVAQLETQLAASSREVASLNHRLSETTSSITSLEDEVMASKSTVDRMRRTRDMLEEENGRLRTLVKQAEPVSKMKVLEQKIVEMEEEKLKLVEEMKTLSLERAEDNKLHDQLGNSERQRKALEQRLSQCMTETENLAESKRKAERITIERTKLQASLEAEVAELKSRLEETERELSATLEERMQLEDSLEEMKQMVSSNDVRSKETEALQKKMDDLMLQSAEARNEASEATRAKEEVEEKLRQLQRRSANMEGAGTLVSRIRKLESACRDKDSQLAALEKETQAYAMHNDPARINSLERDLVSLREQKQRAEVNTVSDAEIPL